MGPRGPAPLPPLKFKLQLEFKPDHRGFVGDPGSRSPPPPLEGCTGSVSARCPPTTGCLRGPLHLPVDWASGEPGAIRSSLLSPRCTRATLARVPTWHWSTCRKAVCSGKVGSPRHRFSCSTNAAPCHRARTLPGRGWHSRERVAGETGAVHCKGLSLVTVDLPSQLRGWHTLLLVEFEFLNWHSHGSGPVHLSAIIPGPAESEAYAAF